MKMDMPQVAAGVAPARDLGWDVLRVLACIMVIVVHARGPYTYHTDGTLDFWAAFYFVLVRAGVPLFVMLSSALLLPLRQTTGDFLKRRFMRVALPFIIWSAIFAFLPLPGDLRGYAPQYNFTPAPVPTGQTSSMACSRFPSPSPGRPVPIGSSLLSSGFIC